MATRALITVDTELMLRRDSDRDDWRALFARSCEPAGVGIGYQLARFAAHGLKATFFVDPMPAQRFGIDCVKAMVEPILAAGQQVQLHLHPGWIDSRHELTDWDEAGQRDLLSRARELLVAAGAPEPVAYRAGSYAANDDTLRALAAIGIRYDSSHNGSHHPWPSAIPLPPAQIAPVLREGVIEVPVGQIRDGGALRHLQLCAVSAAEMRAAIDHAVVVAHPVVSIVSHSFELASRNGARPNGVHVRRFEALCEHLATRAGSVPTAWFTELDDLPLGAPAVPVVASPARAALRKAEQLWSNLYDERRA
ncbi:polysaccharide deacetylase family protein [Sphingomonas sp. 1P06PA]|uniref:polysaccharide deacetylase family protein n=1 Tax=Sphingomonas sp. 1P06PA TaxID=554121 RepID=UPI0039A4EFEA